MAAPTKRHAEEGLEEHSSDSSHKLSTVTANTDKLERFISWAKQEHFQMSQKVTVSKAGSCAQYGMIATARIQEGEVLFQIPRSCLLTPETSGIAHLIQEAGDHLKGTSGWVPLLVSLMYEYNNPGSHWRAYIDLVPDFKELDLPMFWSREERDQLLAGTGVKEAVNSDLQNIETEFTSVVLPFVQKHKDTFSTVCQDLEFYKKMVAFVMAYSFTEDQSTEEEDEEEDPGKPPPMMVPMADILNHVANNNAHLKFEKEALKMVATQNIEKGHEVFNTYGELANWHLLHMYGFAEQYPNNHNDTVDISCNHLTEAASELPVNSGPLLKRKKQLLESMNLAGTSMVVGVDGVLTDEELCLILKVLSSDEEEFTALEEDQEWMEEEDEEELSSFESFCKAPEAWKCVMKRSVELTLRQYGHTVEEDEGQIKNCARLPSRQKFSLYTAHGQKLLLSELLKACS